MPSADTQQYIIPVFGLDGSGKTSLVKRLRGDLMDPLGPTIGFQPHSVLIRRQKNICGFPWNTRSRIKLYDVGGGSGIRGIWKNYVAEAHAIIFVVDGSDPDRFQEITKIFSELCYYGDDRALIGKPVLLLFNHRRAEDLVNLELFHEALHRENLPYVTDGNGFSTLQSTDTHIVQLKYEAALQNDKGWGCRRSTRVVPAEPQPAFDSRILTAIQKLVDHVDRYWKQINDIRDLQVAAQKTRYVQERKKQKERVVEYTLQRSKTMKD